MAIQLSGQEICAYMMDRFGEQLDAYLRPPGEQRNLVGRLIKGIREARPKATTVARHRGAAWATSKARRSKRRLAPGQACDASWAHMSQSDLSLEMHYVWWAMYHEWRSFDGKWIRRLEAGEVLLSPCLLICIAGALRADEWETAMIFEAAGFSGWSALIARKLGRGASVLTYIEQGASGALTTAEVLHLMELQMEAEVADVRPK